MSTATTIGDLAKSYDPASAEAAVRARWDAADAFHAEPDPDGRPYSIVIPPPNVTGALHAGHALNNTLQDILIRVHRMMGCNTLWMPGTDHAGIATQTVVEKRLLRDGKRRTDFSRAGFIEQVQAWKDEYEATITGQLTSLGASCDWARQRFTMDAMCARAVREAFFRLFDDELIYRGKRLVNWDPVTKTALADDEVEMRDVDGSMWYLQYQVVDAQGESRSGGPAHVTVATTRPETMLGDTAVAMNPRDPRAGELRGAFVRIPIVDRIVPIVEDDYVVLPVSLGGDPADAKAEIATGFLKVTPGHDPNDWEIGLRHDLPVINVMAPDASISADHGWDDVNDAGRAYIGLAREEARKAIVAWFDDNGLLESTREYAHSVGHSYRSHVAIEPFLSDQWYVRVSDDKLVGEAQRALAPEQFDGTPPPRRGATTPGHAEHDGGLRFSPPRYARSYQAWHDNLRDWCISRQLWWGHQIPVWSRHGGLPEGLDLDPSSAAIREYEGITHVCVRSEDDTTTVDRLESAGFERDPDVLDTWFSSGLWPLSTMGWPDPTAFPETVGLLETFNPTSVLCTGRDIITLWVSRMVMFNRYFRDGVLPFECVYINPMIQDGHGQRMSKSLGNGVDPRDIMHSHGADALRFTLTQIATATQDVRLPVDMVCPHCEKVFHPKEITNAARHRVAAPEQACPACQKTMVSGYGAAAGVATPDDASPLARNTSSKFDNGRNFANKLWNATRFALGSLGGESAGPADTTVDVSSCSLVDRWIISRLHRTLHAVEDAVENYQFSVYADAMYDFIWGDFCDWYLEAIKPTVRESPAQQQVLRTVLNAILRLLHPVCPYVTETLWPAVQSTGPAGLAGIELPPSDVLAMAAWPDIACRVDDGDAVETFERLKTLIEAIRGLRGAHNVPQKRRIGLVAPQAVADLATAAEPITSALAGLESIEAGGDVEGVPLTFEGHELRLTNLTDAVDIESERARLTKIINEKSGAIRQYSGKLGNPGYVNGAPAHLVDETRQLLAAAEADLAAARGALDAL